MTAVNRREVQLPQREPPVGASRGVAGSILLASA